MQDQFSKIGRETLHVQTRLFGGADVVLRQSRQGSRVVTKRVESFESQSQAQRYVDQLVRERDFRPIGESFP